MATSSTVSDEARIFHSPWPDVEIPDLTIAELVLRKSTELANTPAFVDGPSGRALTYGQLAGAIGRASAGLARRGLRKGDVFAIYSPNLPEYAVAFYGVAAAGGVTTTVNPLYTADELATQLRDAGARFLLTVPPLLERAREAARQTNVEEVFVFGEADGATSFSTLLAGDGPAPDVHIGPADDLAVLPYSSGTTGIPKGVMLTHRNLVANIRQLEHLSHVGPGDRVIGLLPFYHIYGMVVIMGAALERGATVVTLPRFDLEQFLSVMQDQRITRAYLVPPIVLALAKHPLVEKYDLSSLKTIISGAAPLGEGLIRACEARLPGVTVLQGYGLTETSPVTHSNPFDPELIKPASVGPVISNTECKIVDLATGAALGPNEDGEVCVRGPQVMKGYLNHPEATRHMIDPEGWLHTGDVGCVDDDGYLYIVDRVKELIKYKGYQVAPAELEAVLVSNPVVADAAVIPSPNAEAGEVPKAFVVLRSPASEDEIMSYVAERVAPYKKVRQVEVVDQIPKSASGKILRRVLVDRERERARDRAS